MGRTSVHLGTHVRPRHRSRQAAKAADSHAAQLPVGPAKQPTVLMDGNALARPYRPEEMEKVAPCSTRITLADTSLASLG